MAYLPRKVTRRFVSSVPNFQKVLNVAKARDINESDTVEILTDILEAVFGYNKYLELTSEYAIRGRYCDIVVKIENKVQFLIEAKAIGIELKENHLRQAIDYAANHGVQWVILTNGLEWRLYRLRFEKPINYDLVHSFNFLELDPKTEQHQEQLFLLSKEGLDKDVREEFYEKVQVVNRFVVGNLILAEPTLKVIKRELRKLSQGSRVELHEVEQLVRSEVLRRNLVEGEEAEEAQNLICRFYRARKASKSRRRNKKQAPAKSAKSDEGESLSNALLKEAGETQQSAS